MSSEPRLRFGAAACQVDQPNPAERGQIGRNTAATVKEQLRGNGD